MSESSYAVGTYSAQHAGQPNTSLSAAEKTAYSNASEYEDDIAIDDIEDEEDEESEFDGESSFAYMQNRELSWLTFDERVLDQGADESVPLLERLNFISIFWSNLQEFFMVRVGSLTDLSYIEPPVVDSKTGMTPDAQIKAIHERCHELYPIQESTYEHVRGQLAKEGVRHLRPDDLSEEQRNYLFGLVKHNIEPFLSPQIINSRHPFPHLENGKLYILVRLDDEANEEERKKKKKDKAKKKKDKGGAEGVVLGLIPLPHQCERVIKLPGRGFQFILLEHALEMFVPEIFSMYKIKHTNVICVTRNADIDANQTGDEQDEDYREHMKRLLKQRARLAPVRLECERPLSPVMEKLMLKKLGLKRSQVYDTTVPLDLSFTWGLGSRLSDAKRARLSNPPFTPAWPTCFDRKRPIIDQVQERDVLLSYPYESMDPFVQLLREAVADPGVISIKITLYRLASQSHLAEALIAAADAGKEVTALFELRARFDENNNIEWSQRFEQAGCNVLYGFRDYKVHSKICCITRRTPDGSIQHITQLGTGNYNEKTARLYTDFSFITIDEAFGRDAVEFFRNMQLENVSDNYDVLRVAPLQIKTMLMDNLDAQIRRARAGLPASAFMKANSVTDKEIIEKISEASNAGVRITLFIRGICCLIPRIKGATENVRVVSIVGRLLEHSRVYCFGTADDCVVYLSSADLMTRNLNKRVEIAWPLPNGEIRDKVLSYINVCMHDTAKLRELRPNATYTPLGAFCDLDEDGNPEPPFDAQLALIKSARDAAYVMQEPAAGSIEETPAASEPAAQDESEPVAPVATEPAPSAPRESETSSAIPADQPTERIPIIVVPDEQPAPQTDDATNVADDEAPIETFSETAAETIGEAPAESFSEAPAETLGEAPVESFSEAPAETIDTMPEMVVDAEPAAAFGEAVVEPEEDLTELTVGEILSPIAVQPQQVAAESDGAQPALSAEPEAAGSDEPDFITLDEPDENQISNTPRLMLDPSLIPTPATPSTAQPQMPAAAEAAEPVVTAAEVAEPVVAATEPQIAEPVVAVTEPQIAAAAEPAPEYQAVADVEAAAPAEPVSDAQSTPETEQPTTGAMPVIDASQELEALLGNRVEPAPDAAAASQPKPSSALEAMSAALNFESLDVSPMPSPLDAAEVPQAAQAASAVETPLVATEASADNPAPESVAPAAEAASPESGVPATANVPQVAPEANTAEAVQEPVAQAATDAAASAVTPAAGEVQAAADAPAATDAQATADASTAANAAVSATSEPAATDGAPSAAGNAPEAANRVSELIAQLSATPGQEVPLQHPIKQPLQQQTLEASLGMAPAAETTENANEASKDAAQEEMQSFFDTPNREFEVPPEKTSGLFARFRK